MPSQLLARLRGSITSSRAFKWFVNHTTLGDFLLDHFGRFWRVRTREVMECPDNRFIPRVADAGKVENKYQIMHNGLRVYRESYYGRPVTRMLRLNQGVHEPQEERVFAEVLPHIPPGGVMLELGAYWAFYSMWFLQQVKGAKSFLVEPAAKHLALGRRNLELNGMTADITHAYVGGANAVAPDGVRIIGIDDFLREKGIEHLSILHSDIQGYELEMLGGAIDTLTHARADYVFISTHSNELHEQCLTFLKRYNYSIISECNLDDTYSLDGLIVARAPAIERPDRIDISKKSTGAKA